MNRALRLLSLSVACIVYALNFGCSRSPLDGSANYDCAGGDRVLSASRLFCVYTEPRESRPAHAEGEANAGAEVPNEADSDSIFCPIALPEVYVYDTLYICAAEPALSDELIESVIVMWGREHLDETANDQGVSDSGIGVLSGLPDGSISRVDTPTDDEEPNP